MMSNPNSPQKRYWSLTRRCAALAGLALVVLAPHPVRVWAQSGADAAGGSGSDAPLDGRRDFDFSIGNWRTHISRRLHPLTGSDAWAEYVGRSVVRKIWDGRASLGETEADGPAGHLEALSLRLYNPLAHQWNLQYASAGGTTSTPSALTVPTIGAFRNGRGEFFDTELFNGRSILVRNVWSDISTNSIRFEQAFSEDGGRTWEVNWVAVDTREDVVAGASAPSHETPTEQTSPSPASDKSDPSSGHDGRGHEDKRRNSDHQRDFDFEYGLFKVHIRRLRHPLSGSSEWTDYDGTSTLAGIWNRRANVGELEVEGSGTHIEGLSLRLYNPKSGTWSIYWANSRDGTTGTPMVGRFNGGRGEFYGSDSLDGAPIFVRFIFSNISPSAYRLEQSYSADGGKSWEPNWIASFTRSQP